MKTVAKVFLVLSMIAQFFLIYPLVLGIIMYKKINAAKKADDISTAWKVVTLLFVNVISGVLLLIMKDKDYA